MQQTATIIVQYNSITLFCHIPIRVKKKLLCMFFCWHTINFIQFKLVKSSFIYLALNHIFHTDGFKDT